jgi:hypothetical protein
MYSITENIYCSQLSSVAILLQSEPNCFTLYNTRKALCSLSVLSYCGLPLSPTCLLLTANEARSYFASTIELYRSLARVFIVQRIIMRTNFPSPLLLTEAHHHQLQGLDLLACSDLPVRRTDLSISSVDDLCLLFLLGGRNYNLLL